MTMSTPDNRRGIELDSTRSLILLAIGLLLLTACGPAPTPAPMATSEPTAAIDPEPPVIADAADLEAHLAERGIELQFNAETEMDYLPGPARVYELGSGDSLELHVYASEAEAAAAAALIRPDNPHWIEDPQEPDEPWYVDWKGQPQVYRQGALLAIYIGQDGAALAAFEEALGPPIASRAP